MSKKEKKANIKIPDFLINIGKVIEEEGKSLDMRAVTLTRSGFIKDAVSTGSLATDLMIGGGYSGGRFISNFGPEASGKTSGVYEAIGECMASGVPVLFYDAEQATDPDYLDRVIQKKTGRSMEDFVGQIDGNKITKAGLLYYFQPNTGENVFRMIRRILKKAIPDVVKDKKLGWCWAEHGRTKNDYKLVPREIGGMPSILVVVDSLIALVPEAKDENDESSPLAQVARMLSASFPMVVTPVGRKRAVFIYTNQERTKIGGYGNPIYEPGGDAAKFYSSMRVRYSSCATSSVDKVFITVPYNDEDGKGLIEQETHWDGEGKDKYRYAKLKTTKNKQFSPFQTTYVRYRFENGGAPGDGICPSFDAYMYLYKTGQCSKKTGKGLTLYLLGTEDGKEVSTKLIEKLTGKAPKEKKKKKDDVQPFELKLTWLEFKAMVEDPSKKNALRKYCREQMNTGYAWDLYFSAKEADNKGGEE